MYQLDWLQRLRVANTQNRTPGGVADVSANVWKLGFTSFFTDISSEMVSSILPLYFVSYLQFTPLQYGVLDGVYQGGAVAILSLLSGICADRWRRQKEVATAGYAFSAVSKLGLMTAGTHWGLAVWTLALDRVGKGIRTAPRDAMISLCSRPEALATAFAVHRALDAGGAVFGPLAAYLLLRMAPGAYDLVLVASFCIGLIGVGLISLLVTAPEIPERGERAKLPSFGALRNAPLLPMLIVSGLLSVATVSDGFLYLLLQKSTHSPLTALPLFAFLTAVFYVVASVPAGKLADRWGRKRMFLGGYVLMLLAYGILLAPDTGTLLPWTVVGLMGAYYAATDGVLAAMASGTIPPEQRAGGLALLNTVVSVARFISSVAFGWMWSARGTTIPVWIFLGGLVAAMTVSMLVLKDRKSA